VHTTCDIIRPRNQREGIGEPSPSGVFRLAEGSARRLLVECLADLVRQLRTAQVRRIVTIDGDYRQVHGWQLPSAGSFSTAYQALTDRAEALASEFPVLADGLHSALAELAPVLEPTVDLSEVWSRFERAVAALGDFGIDQSADGTCTIVASPKELRITVPTSRVGDGLPVGLGVAEYLSSVGAMQRRARALRRRPTLHQIVAEHVAYGLLARGARSTGPYRTWGTSGFRDHQTYMSVTDPGEGHLDGTLRDYRYVDGVIVHIEHLERGAHQDRDVVEPYRIPFPLMVGRIRLALGADAPSSSYVGRPVFEADVETGMLKTVHTMAAACSELFAEGLTECKIAIEGLTATQAVRFMRMLSAAIRRDRFNQVLSAAFNLNTPIIDDRPSRLLGRFSWESVSPRFAAGMLGIELARAGGFDKVTWDGTGDSYPSGCVLEQISASEALTLVHLAHEAGLLTYFSAGFRFVHLPRAVHTGVDGVGVGGAQILRYMDKVTGNHGPFVPENIARILEIRNEAETSPRGRAAALLSRLDRMHFEWSIGEQDEMRRRELFELLCNDSLDSHRLDALLTELRHVEQMAVDTEHPLVSWVQRLEQAGADSLLAATVDDWRAALSRLSVASDRQDFDYLSDQLESLRHYGKTAALVAAA
jgi:hypothetical protein